MKAVAAKFSHDEKIKPAKTAPDMLTTLAMVWALLAPPTTLTVNEAADLIGRCPEAVRRLCRRGELGRWDKRLGLYLIERGQLARYVEARPRQWREVPRALREFASTQTRPL
jgi:hypothetical protein